MGLGRFRGCHITRIAAGLNQPVMDGLHKQILAGRAMHWVLTWRYT